MNRRRVDSSERTVRRGAFARRVLSAVARALGLLAASALLVYGAVAGWAWLRTDEQFALKHLQFRGVTRAAPAELARLAGLADGLNLFSIDLAAAALAMEDDAWVAHARVARALPDSIVVDIEEHVPVALVAVVGGVYAVTADGVLFKRVISSDRLDLPVITGLSRDAFAGERRTGDPTLRAALDLVALFETHGAADQSPLAELHVHTDAGEPAFTAWCGDEPVEVRLGAIDPDHPDAFAARLERLARVREALARQKTRPRRIDLGNRLRPDWIAVRPEIAPTESTDLSRRRNAGRE
jgi:hypothetical protein